jgi:hypothetical protein
MGLMIDKPIGHRKCLLVIASPIGNLKGLKSIPPELATKTKALINSGFCSAA